MNDFHRIRTDMRFMFYVNKTFVNVSICKCLPKKIYSRRGNNQIGKMLHSIDVCQHIFRTHLGLHNEHINKVALRQEEGKYRGLAKSMCIH